MDLVKRLLVPLVVLAFVIVMMLLVTVLDFIFGRLAGFVFGGTPLWPLW